MPHNSALPEWVVLIALVLVAAATAPIVGQAIVVDGATPSPSPASRIWLWELMRRRAARPARNAGGHSL